MLDFRQFMEMGNDTIHRLKTWMEDGELSFKNLFGDKTRVVLPIAASPLMEIKRKIEALTDPSTGQSKGYKVDLPKGLVYQNSTTLQGNPLKRTIKLGRVIEKELGDNEKDYYNRTGHQGAENQEPAYSIIISRHPIDVVRMSDHDNISSCHSPNGDYFHCAMSEAQGNGPIAYLVSDAILEKLQPGKLNSNDEIFADDDRHIRGITPKARLRLRKYVNKKFGYELAIPESRIYGISKATPLGEKFYKAVLNWSQKNQTDLIAKDHNIKDFTRMGGSYQDNVDSDLFTKFFGKEKHGTAEYEGDEEFENTADQWEEEIQSFDRQYNKFTNPIYGHASIENDGDGPPYLYINGNVTFVFDKRELIADLYNQEHQIINRLEKEIKEVLEEFNNGVIEQIDIHIDDKVKIHVDIRYEKTDGEPDGPDDYRYFLTNELGEWDKVYLNAKAEVRQIFINNKYMNPGPLDQKIATWHPQQFKNFQWKEEGYAVEVTSKEFWVASFNQKNKGNNYIPTIEDQQYKTFSNLLHRYVMEMVKKVRTLDRQQLMLPGFKRPGTLPTPKWPLIELKVKTRLMQQQVVAYLDFEIHTVTSEKELKNTEAYIQYLDRNFNNIAQTAARIFAGILMGKETL